MAFDLDDAVTSCGSIDCSSDLARSGGTWTRRGDAEPDWAAELAQLLNTAEADDIEWLKKYQEGGLPQTHKQNVEEWLEDPEGRRQQHQQRAEKEVERRRSSWVINAQWRLTEQHRRKILERGFTEAHVRWMFDQGFVRSLTAAEVKRDWHSVFPLARTTSTGGLLLCFDPYNPRAEKRTYSLRCDNPPVEQRLTGARTAKYLYAAGSRDPMSGEFIDEHGNPLNAQQPFVPNGLIGPDGERFGDAQIATEGLFDALICTLLLGVPCVGLTAPGHLRGSKLPKGVRVYIGDADQWLAPGLLPTIVGQCVSKQLALARLPLREGHNYLVRPRDLHPDAKAGMEELHADLGPEKARETVLAIAAQAQSPGDYLKWEIEQLKQLGLRWPDHAEATNNLISAIADAHRNSSPNREVLRELLQKATHVSKQATFDGIKDRLARIKEREGKEGKLKREAERRGLLSKGIAPEPEIDREAPTNQQLQEFLAFTHQVRFNELTQLVELDGTAITEPRLSYQLLSQLHGVEARKEQASDVLTYLGRDNAYNPIADYLKHVAGDESLEPISSRELASLFGIDPSDTLSIELLWRSLGGTALRGLTPGCKFDQCPILHGEQGLGKSEALKALAGPDWYDVLGDQKDLALDSWAVSAKMNRCWMLELGEVGRLTRGKHADEFKVWLSTSNSRYAEKGEKNATDHPKRAVPWGTTNDEQLLNDPTGTRRFWIIRITRRTDWEGIATARDRIWRTVQLWLARGLSVWLNPSDAEERKTLYAAALRGAEASYEDPWLENILKRLDEVASIYMQNRRLGDGCDALSAYELRQLKFVPVTAADGSTIEAPLVTTGDLLEALRIDPGQRDKGKATRAGILMKDPLVAERGWQSYRNSKVRGYVWLPPSGDGGVRGGPGEAEVTPQATCHADDNSRCHAQKPWYNLDLKPDDTSLIEIGG